MRVLAVDDDEDFAFGLRGMLRRDGVEVTSAHSGREAVALSTKAAWDAVLLDLGLPDVPGLEVLRALIGGNLRCPVIVLSGRDEAGAAAEALRLGAMHYVTKPATREGLLRVIEEARERGALRLRMDQARSEATVTAPRMIGQSAPWRAAMDDLRAAASSPRTPVLVTGESGTGKELAAAQIHAWSARAARPFVTVNAACFAPSLLESELFGHEAGAFTGATSKKAGLFELASGGTLFLDEVGELPLELQPKLLRLLEGHPFRRVGGERAIVADVRIVSATNCRMEEAVAKGRFRLDLYHRLRVVEVSLPPLRERGPDAELLAIHFVSRLGVELGKPDIEIAPETLRAIRCHPWPGNVRELKNAMERAIVLNRTGRITPEDLPRDIRPSSPCHVGGSLPCDTRPSFTPDIGHPLPHDVRQSLPCGAIATPALLAAKGEAEPASPRSGHGLDDVVKQHVLEAYRESAGNLARAARALGIGRATLRRRLRDYGVTLEGPSRPRRA